MTEEINQPIDAEIVKEWKTGEPEPGLPAVVQTSSVAVVPEKPERPPVVDEHHQLILSQQAIEEKALKKKEEEERQRRLMALVGKPGFSALPTKYPQKPQEELPVAAAAQKIAEENVDTTLKNATVGVSREENEKCLAAIALLFEVPDLSYKDQLRNLTLVDKGSAPLAPASLLVNTSSNIIDLAKGKVEFQDSAPLSAVDALEGALLAGNDIASYPDGVYLHGNDRDRYMLMLAAQRVGLTVANPVTVSTEVKNEVETEFFAHIARMQIPDEPVAEAPHTNPKVDEMVEAAESITTPPNEPDMYGRMEPFFTRKNFVPAV